jgi:hypothetical protein
MPHPNYMKQIRFLERYGTRSPFRAGNFLRQLATAQRHYELEMFRLYHPFGEDLSACAETNS